MPNNTKRLEPKNKTKKRTKQNDVSIVQELFDTSTSEFIEALQKYSNKLGVNIRQHGLYVSRKGCNYNSKINAKIVSVRDIFKLLFLKYVPIHKRKTKQDLQSVIPIIDEPKTENPENNCFTSCDKVPLGTCATGCKPSWGTIELKHTRNWCNCNINNGSCKKPICSRKHKL